MIISSRYMVGKKKSLWENGLPKLWRPELNFKNCEARFYVLTIYQPIPFQMSL